jgi:hypothetical protein
MTPDPAARPATCERGPPFGRRQLSIIGEIGQEAEREVEHAIVVLDGMHDLELALAGAGTFGFRPCSRPADPERGRNTFW